MEGALPITAGEVEQFATGTIPASNAYSFPIEFRGNAPNVPPFTDLLVEKTTEGIRWSFRTAAQHVFGLGERFDRVDQYGLRTELEVYEKFTEQGGKSYLHSPFFFTELGFSVEVEGTCSVLCDFASSQPGVFSLHILCGEETPPTLIIRYGKPAQLLEAFSRERGLPAMPPSWVLGPWISSNRWNSRVELMKQIDIMERVGIPATVVVLEAWSDEGGFFAWNDSVDCEDGFYAYPDNGLWPDPKGMIAELGRRGLKLVLWQVPVVKQLADCPDKAKERLARAHAEADANGYFVKRKDGSTYLLPDGRWFGGSPIPDFTNPEACRWFFGKRKHLLDQGVAGFKTDGGEFIYEDDLVFADGSTSHTMKNGYAARYLEEFGRFAGPERVLFSRAGWAGSQRWSVHWAGDQKSTWDELQAQLSAGLSAGLSGFPYWTFDIAGFAGALPSSELYLRAFAFGVFSPLMQWHSEPVYGQFAKIMKGSGGNNDRSPWNIAAHTGDDRVIPLCRALSRLRMALIPYLEEQFRKASVTGLPIIRHLVLDHPDDIRAREIHDEYLLGPDLLVAPVVELGCDSRTVYFPEGRWIDIRSGSLYTGESSVVICAQVGDIPVFRREGSVIPLDPVWTDSNTPPYLSGRNI
jgi:alpha-D-xyloside xylohydrolase